MSWTKRGGQTRQTSLARDDPRGGISAKTERKIVLMVCSSLVWLHPLSILAQVEYYHARTREMKLWTHPLIHPQTPNHRRNGTVKSSASLRKGSSAKTKISDALAALGPYTRSMKPKKDWHTESNAPPSGRKF